jgi:hypothetical protein
MMKTKINKARVFVTSKYKSEGSVLRETVKAVGFGFSTRLELESGETAEKWWRSCATQRTAAM